MERCWISTVPLKVRSGAAAQGPVVTRNRKGQEQNPKVRRIQKGLGCSIKAAGFRRSVAVW